MRGKGQSAPRWTTVVRPLESVLNVRTEEEAKEAMARQRSRVGRDATRLILFSNTPTVGAKQPTV